MKNNKGIASIVIILIVVGALAAGGYYYWSRNSQKQVACTMDAKICPDGSSVGRTGPDCEFAECPEVKNDETANWKTHSDTVYGYEIKYPSGWVYSDRTPADCSLDHPCISSVSIHSTIATAWVGIDVVNNNEISIDQLKAQKLQEIKIYPEGRVEDIKIGNIRAIRVEYLPSKPGAVNWQRSIYMVNNNLIYIIRVPGVDNSPDIQKIIDQIPFTFNFIEKSGNQTTNWKTYTNSIYSYQISYPKDIYTTENLANPGESINPNNVRLVNIKQAQESIKCECGEAEAIVISAYANTQKLSAEEYLKQNFQRWLGTPSSYSNFYINEQTTFNGLSARKFGTERDQYFIFTKGSNVFTITIGDQNILNTFKFTN